MKYMELLDEYSALLNSEVKLRLELHEIPKGYLVTKRISGKEYLYLQYTEHGKKKTEYIREEDYNVLNSECIQIKKMLIASINTVKNK